MPHVRVRRRRSSVLRLWKIEWLQSMLVATAIGALGALATISFREGLFGLERLLYGPNTGLVAVATFLPWWGRMLVPALGGSVAGLLLLYGRRAYGGRDPGDYMEAIALGTGDLGVRSSLIRALSSAATVSTGGAIGREGPMVQLAALTGSLIGRWRNVPVPRRRLMVACGAAAGIATAYNAPIAGALFVAEILLQSLAVESLGPLIVASVSAHVTLSELVGAAPTYQMPTLSLPDGRLTLVFAALGLAAGVGAPLYLRVLDQVRGLFNRLAVPLPAKMALGGLVVGLLSILSPEVWGNGYSVVDSILQGHWAVTALLLVLVTKLLAVATTTGSGAVGGIFTPTLFMGSVAGALFAHAAQWLLPDALPAPAAIAIGMGAFLSACTHAPLTSVLMIFEMTQNYGVIVPLMLACVVGYYVSRVLRPVSIYANSQQGKAAQASLLTFARDLMRSDTPKVRPGQPLRAVEETFARNRWPHVYVVDGEEKLIGSIPVMDLAAVLKEHKDGGSPWPTHLLHAQHPRVSDATPLWELLETFARHTGERLPVIDGNGKLLGHITKTSLLMILSERTGLR